MYCFLYLLNATHALNPLKALEHKISTVTTAAMARLILQAIKARLQNPLQVYSLQEQFQASRKRQASVVKTAQSIH